ncbi:hypothetical protein [Pseudomonas sp. BEA3.1]|uniref:hypothetical protein n=1 Tax=Pseudomonas sp. BEA3.1 TaxID=3083251 RepID=UPI0029652AE9|nr:hypothetical protein [Pseudomonas sp. BEA3.1]MDW2777936.1 hypothetical protein [Pseudomonas sp. BEA3.1]
MALDSGFRVGTSKFFASPWGSLLLTLFSVLSAGYISICSSPILTQCQALLGTAPEGTDPPDTYLHSIVALVLTVLALLMVGLRERGLADIALRKEKALAALEEKKKEELADIAQKKEQEAKDESKAMEGRLTNLPPRQFISDYVETLKQIGELRRLTKNEIAELTPDDVIGRIQTMMSSVLSLARLWDDISASNKFVTYHASIMRILNSDEISLSPVRKLNLRMEDEVPTEEGSAHAVELDTVENEQTLEQWMLQFEFFLHNQSYQVAVERCSGILFIQDLELSVESQNPDRRDQSVEQICLPFTLKDQYKRSFHHPNLPGAPEAAASGQPVYIADVRSTVENWFTELKKKDKEVSARYEEEVTLYYQNLEHTKSLMSLPLFHNGSLLGVLNVSRDLENMLMKPERAELFVHLMNPVCYHLGKMLASLEASESSQDSGVIAEEDEDEN